MALSKLNRFNLFSINISAKIIHIDLIDCFLQFSKQEVHKFSSSKYRIWPNILYSFIKSKIFSISSNFCQSAHLWSLFISLLVLHQQLEMLHLGDLIKALNLFFQGHFDCSLNPTLQCIFKSVQCHSRSIMPFSFLSWFESSNFSRVISHKNTILKCLFLGHVSSPRHLKKGVVSPGYLWSSLKTLKLNWHSFTHWQGYLLSCPEQL